MVCWFVGLIVSLLLSLCVRFLVGLIVCACRCVLIACVLFVFVLFGVYLLCCVFVCLFGCSLLRVLVYVFVGVLLDCLFVFVC